MCKDTFILILEPGLDAKVYKYKYLRKLLGKVVNFTKKLWQANRDFIYYSPLRVNGYFTGMDFLDFSNNTLQGLVQHS